MLILGYKEINFGFKLEFFLKVQVAKPEELSCEIFSNQGKIAFNHNFG